MNLFNLVGTGQDLNTGAFVTVNGKQWKESLNDLVQAFKEANNLGATKKGTVLSWLAGNFNKDYDFVKDLNADTEALQNFMDWLHYGAGVQQAVITNRTEGNQPRGISG